MGPTDRLPNALAGLIAANYGLHVARSEGLEGGDEAIAWRAEAERPLLVHQSPTWRTAAEFAWVHALIACIAPALPEAVAPLRTHDGHTFIQHDDALVTLYPWVAGVHVDRADELQRKAAAELLARLHRTLLECSMPTRMPNPNDPWAGRAPTDPSELVDPDLDTWCAQLESRTDLTSGLVHGDYYRRNLLWADGRIVAVVDWHEARHDLLIREVASAVWEFSKDSSGRTLAVESAYDFLDCYRDAGGPAEVDGHELIVPLIRSRLREEARTSLGLAARGLPDTHSPYRDAVTSAFVALRKQSL